MPTLNVNELDFFLIKDNIKTFLKGQSEFTDYNFEGSGMNVLMDLLAYSTHYMGVYNNMTFNEMFLETGLLRSSVVSKALELNYVPKQETAAKATINLSITLQAPKPSSVFVPRNTKFSCKNELNEAFTFLTDTDYTLLEVGTSGVFTGDVDIVEGTYITESTTHDINNPVDFILQNSNVDMTYTTVEVEDFAGSTAITPWLKYQNIVDITPTTKAYFWREGNDGLTEIYFGDGVIGQQLIDNNVVNITYLVTHGESANNIDTFSLVTGISPYTVNQFTITSVSSSSEGSGKESLDSIKHNAPLFYQTQNRSVVKEDYIRILTAYHGGSIDAINVWGGEENDPPIYGRVMISIKPVSGTLLSNTTKDLMAETLESFGVVGIIPQFVDPVYTYIDLNVKAKYQDYLTTKTEAELSVIIDTALDNHFNDNLYLFDATFKYSEVLALIDDSDQAMYNNFVDLTLHQDFIPAIQTPFTYSIDFNNAILPGSVALTWTNLATEVMTVTDDSLGNVFQYRDGVLIATQLGTVDYVNGVILLSDFNPNLSAVTTLQIYITPTEPDVYTVQNNILLKGDTTITLEAVTA
jgi:hypothetical protein